MCSELATKIPERIASLSLIVTKPGRRRLVELPPVSSYLFYMRLRHILTSSCQYTGLKNLTRTMMIREPEKRIPYVLEMLFPQEWLDAKNPDDPEGRTNREIQTEVCRPTHM